MKGIIQDSFSRLQKIQVLTVILLLILLPTWGMISSEITHKEMHSEMVFIGGQYTTIDPVLNSIGPSYNTKDIIREMEENPGAWLPELVDEVVDIDELTRFPGRIALYRLTKNRYIITYTYLAPIPITRGYGFQYTETDGERIIIAENSGTYIFPMDPSATGKLADIS